MDFPHPDGPIIEVMLFLEIVKFSLSIINNLSLFDRLYIFLNYLFQLIYSFFNVSIGSILDALIDGNIVDNIVIIIEIKNTNKTS